ncbi:MAG TPA: LamG-like jellyroll fold domain-containing protein, partial [Anaerolineales bacterium]|nr:LamG-like jellyroll fold domain-containing protein [Anaerolineales bacterium]
LYGDYYGGGQGSGIIPVTGTYLLRVEPYYNYYGEYQFRLTLAPQGTQVESEGNDSTGSADPLSLPLNNGSRSATVLGYIAYNDSSDFFRLANLSAGATIDLNIAYPTTSGLLGSLFVYDANGSIVAHGPAGAPSLTYTVPPGGDGVHYVRAWDAGPVGALKFGHDGYALRLTGSEWINFTNAVIPASGDFTVECWAVSDAPGTLREILSQGSGGNAFYLGSENGRIRAGDGWSDTGIAFPVSGWHHFAVVKSSTNTLLFVDGILQAVKGASIPNPVASTPLRIGRQYGSYGEYWRGSIDEVRIWNVARTPAAILNTMSTRLGGSEAGLVGYWHFDQGPATTSGPDFVSDATAFANTGAGQGNLTWTSTARTNARPSSLFSEYLLHLELQDTASAAITSVTLPPAGSTNMSIWDRFNLGLSKDIDPSLNNRNRALYLYGGHAYTITSDAVTWYNAEVQARALGGHLVTINDALENDWLLSTFSSHLNFWTGINDEAQKGVYVWASAEPAGYTNWASGQPNNSNNQDYGTMRAGGQWFTDSPSTTHRGIIEVAGPDMDADGLPDSIDPYPNDPFNAFDLRASGPDGLFDTPDDGLYHVSHANYSSGLSLSFTVSDGPLQPGNYRFMVTGSLRDLFGNPMTVPFTHYFTIDDLPGYALENRNNGSTTSATPLPMVEDPPG